MQSNGMKLDPALAAPQARTRWFREPWMALVVGGPLLVVAASIATAVIAYKSEDKVLGEDYYKQGLHVNEDMQRDAKARLYNLQAVVTRDDHELLVQLTGGAKMPARMELELAVGMDGQTVEQRFKVALRQTAPGQYRGALPLPLWQDSHVWHLKLQQDDWRLNGQWLAVRDPAVKIQAAN